MNKSLLRVAALALPVLFAASCGGSDLFGTDGGVDQGLGSCPAGVVLYRLTTAPAPGTLYPAVPGSGMIVSDTCNTGFMGSAVEQSRSVSNDQNAEGTVTLRSADGQTILGSGPVRCNTGTLTYGPNPPVYTDDGTCRYATSNSVNFTTTADSAFTIEVAQTRTDSTSDTGMTCLQPPASCTLTYRVSQKM